MFWKTERLIYFITLLSGTAGLIYEIVWTRMLILDFGNSTHSIVAIISAFLGGLALGSLLIGSWCSNIRPEKLIRIYSLLEFGIGITALLSLTLLSLDKYIYGFFTDGSRYTVGLLILKFFLTTGILLLPTTLMGGTLPVLVSILHNRVKNIDINVALLYSFNTLGAVLGVFIAAFISIELFGLLYTLILGALLNFLAGLLTFTVSKDQVVGKNIKKIKTRAIPSLSKYEITVLFCFMFSGFISIAYEVLWTRVLTPVTGTFVYAFSFILILYLSGIAIGSFFYKSFTTLTKNRNRIFAISQAGIGIFALLSVFIISNYTEKSLVIIFSVIFPASVFMGISFPAANACFKKQHNSGGIISISYFSNTIGCITGGFLASFVLIPLIGSAQAILLLSFCNFLLALILVMLTFGNIKGKTKTIIYASVCILLIYSGYLFFFKRNGFYESSTNYLMKLANQQHAKFYYYEDDIASVVGFHNDKNDTNYLLVDGIPITGKVIETRLMAHIPVALHPNPKSILDICFGMGSTYHSAMLHNISTDAVELSPSVVKMFPVFYPDANKILANPKGHIIINDGRNYVNLTRKKYDIVTIDPPPPFNAAGTTVLYSEEFYRSMIHILNPKGLVSQWVYYGSRKDDIQMVTKSFINVFPYVIAIRSPGSVDGIYLIGSPSPISTNSDRINKVFSTKAVQNDLSEFNMQFNAKTIESLIIGDRNSLVKLTNHTAPVTDNYPRTEYFLLRHVL